MTFNAYEISVDEGRPLELLKVTYLTNNWYYTSADTEQIHDGQTYLPLPMTRGSINPTGDVSKSSLAIKVPQDCPVGELFRVQPPSGVVTVTLFLKHADDAEVKSAWKGRVVNVEWEEPWLTLTTENVYSSLQRVGVRRKYSTQCPHALYSQGEGLCNVDKNAYKFDYTVSGLTGATITCPGATSKPANYFAGGKVEWIHAEKGYLEQRMVLSSDTSGHLVLSSPPPGLVAGATVSAYPGCDHLDATCHSKFGNSLNFGGTPFIPKKNPFGGSTLF